ncbi:FAD synthase [Halomarina litorea]|uniref:FAD synthase n=1 Tax=Halomarina litorea TaxID=2961595 RepID=UPI0020C3DF31|nr:FAD synthase [Halomarina sp. BCD28]
MNGDESAADGPDVEAVDPETRRVVAQGTFDLLHPGHLHYLREAAQLGELHVIVARRENVTHKPKPVLADRQRRDMVAALDCVHDAHLGHLEDIFVPIEAIRPDVILLGHDQHHDEAAIEGALAERGIDCEVRRASGREPNFEGELYSTGAIIDRICEERCPPGE